jgi:hypothetical protein
MSAIELGTLSADVFAPHLNESFLLMAPTGETPVVLAEVRRLGTALREGGAFALVFVAEGAPHWPQAIYPLSHPHIGRLDMFLVPVGPLASGLGYEAVFT